MNFEKILIGIPDIYYVVFDELGNIIYPKDKIMLNFVKKLMCIREKNDLEIYDISNETWYETWDMEFNVQGGRGRVVYFKDISKYKAREDAYKIDEGTNLSSKKLTYELVREYISYALNNNEEFSIVFADADNFKIINDKYGHHGGDFILSVIGQMFTNNIRHSSSRNHDILGRIGGDEFLILFKNVTEKTTLNRIEEIRNIFANAEVYYELMDKNIRLCTISFGYYHVSKEEIKKLRDSGKSVDDIRSELMRKSDKAMYETKTSGKNAVTSYSRIKKKNQ